MFAPHTLGALMAERFEVYKREAVAPFYDDHFRHYSRQIVLVDVLRALLAGRDAFEDTRLALDAILESFRYGHGGILSKLLRGPHIDKVLFAATKADHVPDIQRDHLAALLRNMAAFPALEVKSSNAQFEVKALASVISTAEDTQEIDGQRVQVVVGRPVGSTKQAKFFVGNVPIRPPRPDAWGSPFLNVPVFEPPAIDPVADRRDRAHQSRPGARIPAGRPAAMTDQSDRKAPITARVIEIDAADELARPRPIGPQVIATERTEPVTPSERSVVVVAPPPARRRDGVITFGLAGLAVFFVGWLVVDAAAWISTAFERSAGLGVLAAAAISAGVAGAGAGDRA